MNDTTWTEEAIERAAAALWRAALLNPDNRRQWQDQPHTLQAIYRKRALDTLEAAVTPPGPEANDDAR